MRRLVKPLLLDGATVSTDLLLVFLVLLGLGYTDKVVEKESGSDVENDVGPENTVKES